VRNALHFGVFPFAETFEGLCLLSAVFYLRKERNNYWLWFIPFLTVTLVTELAGKFIAQYMHQRNVRLYNIYLLADILFVFWILYKSYPNQRKWRNWFIFLFIGLTILYSWESMVNHFNRYNNLTDTVSSFVFVFLCGAYYYLLLKDESYHDLLKFPAFWIVSGLFLFNFGSTVIDLFSDELLDLYVLARISLRYAIIVFLMAILYGCWIYAFRCKYQETILS
jgi:hypothetical protein